MIPILRLECGHYPLGVIFDLDGTLIDNEELHKTLFQDTARSLGYSLSDDEYRSRLSGLTDSEVMEYILAAAHRSRSISELVTVKLGRYLKQIQTGGVQTIPGAVPFVRSLRECGVRIAVATNASKREADIAVALLGLADVVETCVTIESVTRGKPAPDIHLRAARLLGLAPSDCLVYEDSLHGIQAAVAAGMRVVSVGRTGYDRVRQAGAMMMIEDFDGHDLPAMLPPLTSSPRSNAAIL